MPRPPASLLVLAYGHGLGDSVLCLPLLLGIREAWPACRVTLATTAPTLSWLDGAGLVDEPVALEASRLWEALGVLSVERFEVAVDLRLDHTVESALFARLLGARRLVGFACPLRRVFFDEAAPPDYVGSTHAENLRRLAGLLGVPWRRVPPPVSEAAREWADRWLSERGVGRETPLVLLAPGARHDLPRVDKRWPASAFAELARLLRSRGVVCALTGVASERALCKQVAREGGALDACGETSPETLAALFLRARLVVGNNSGPVQLAAALDVPTLSFSGGVNLVHWRPQGERARVILRDAGCREALCLACPDKGERCLGKILPERVAGLALAMVC